MTSKLEPLPSDLAAAHAMIRAERNARVMAEANAAIVKSEAAHAQADLSSSEALNVHLKLEINLKSFATSGAAPGWFTI